MNEAKKARLLDLLVHFSFMTGEFTLASGKKSDYYFDFRSSASDPEAIKLVGELFFEKVTAYDEYVEAVAGAIFGAAPMVTSICIESYLQNQPVRGVYIRKEPKKYGTKSFVEGYLDPDSPVDVLMIEDVITTGGSILRAVDNLLGSHPNCNILGILGLLDRMEGGRENIEKAGYDLWTLFTVEDLFKAKKAKK